MCLHFHFPFAIHYYNIVSYYLRYYRFESISHIGRGRGGNVRRREWNLSGVATEVCGNQVWSHYYNSYFAYFQNQ